MSAILTQAALIFCFVAGKSGGHLMPCITQAEKILQTDPSSQVYLFSSGTELDEKIMAKHQTINHYVPAILDGIPYKQPWLYPFFTYQLASYFFHALYKLWHLNPTKILSFGGLNSIPVCLAGKLIGIPFELYELNVEPGQSIKFLSYFTDTINICFAQTAQYFQHKTCVLKPYPVRFKDVDRIYNRKELITTLHLSLNKKTILILGGSQGSLFVNQAIKYCLEQDTELQNQIQIIHQIGIYDQADYQQFYQEHNIPAVVFAYNERLQDFYNLADLVICRAGAGTLFEVEFFKKQCIIIPLQTDLNDHQVSNAHAIAAMYPDRFSVIMQQNCNTSLRDQIRLQLA